MSDGDMTTDEQEVEARSYAREALDVLADLRSGTLVHELGEGLAEIAQAIRQNGKGSGKVVLTLGIRAAARGGGQTVNIAGEVKVSLPKAETAETVMFTDDAGKLSRRHPNQPELPFGT